MQVASNRQLYRAIKAVGLSFFPHHYHAEGFTLYNLKFSSPQIQFMMTHIETPTDFWAQLVNDSSVADISMITENVNTVCPSASAVSGTPQLYKVECFKLTVWICSNYLFHKTSAGLKLLVPMFFCKILNFVETILRPCLYFVMQVILGFDSQHLSG